MDHDGRWKGQGASQGEKVMYLILSEIVDNFGTDEASVGI